MKTKNMIIGGLIALFFAASSAAAFACGGDASGKHIGKVTSVDAGKSTFTIRDAETRAPITFTASKAMLSKAKSADGNIMVNYEENADGRLEAMGISL